MKHPLPTNSSDTIASIKAPRLQKVTEFFVTYGPFILFATTGVVIVILFTLLGAVAAPALSVVATRRSETSHSALTTPLLLEAVATPQKPEAFQQNKIRVLSDVDYVESGTSTKPSTAISIINKDNCDNLASILSLWMQDPDSIYTFCTDETGLLNLHCALKVLCPQRVLTSPVIDLSNLTFTFSSPAGQNTIFLRVTNAGTATSFDYTIWKADGQTTIIFQGSHLPNSTWRNVTFPVPVQFKNGTVAGSLFEGDALHQDQGDGRSALTFLQTLVNGLRISGPKVISPNNIYGSISFILTQGGVELRGEFDGVAARFIGTTGDIIVSDATMGKSPTGVFPQSLIISNQLQDDGTCLQSYVNNLQIKLSDINGLNTFPIFDSYIIQPCSTPPVINQFISTNNNFFCIQFRSSAQNMNFLMQSTKVVGTIWNQCSYDSGVFKINGSMKILDSQLLNIESFNDNSSNTSTLDIRYTTFQVNHSQGPVFQGTYQNVSMNNVTSNYPGSDATNRNYITLLGKLITEILSLAGSGFDFTVFSDVYVAKSPILIGPNSGYYMVFDDVNFICENGGVVPVWSGFSNHSTVYCSPTTGEAETSDDLALAIATPPVSKAGLFSPPRVKHEADQIPVLRLQ